MKLIIKNDIIIATHANDQAVEHVYDYDKILIVPDDTKIDITIPVSEQLNFTDSEYNDSIRQQRSSRYKAESDPLKIEAEYDAQIIGGAPDYSLWLEQVAQIKAALPYK